MVKKNLFTTMVAAGTLLAGLAQADPVSMTSTQINTFDLSWQEIVGATWEDASGDNIIEVGELVTFTLTMDKQYRGDHDFDVMKIWVDDEVIGAPASANGDLLKTSGYEYIWDETGGHDLSDPYTGDPKSFTFTKSFGAVGTYDLTASVMCSMDLSHLYKGWSDAPTTYDFSLWKKTTASLYHGDKRWQGETEKYQFSVTQNVPEPTILSLLGCGLLGLVFFRRKK